MPVFVFDLNKEPRDRKMIHEIEARIASEKLKIKVTKVLNHEQA